MVTVKGPIKIQPGKDASFLLEGSGLAVKPPFEATGWESTRIPEGIDMSGVKLKKEIRSVKPEPIEEKVE